MHIFTKYFRFLTIGRELQEIGANHADFAHFAQSSSELREIRPHGQQSANESRELQEITANHANSAPFAPKAGKLREICDICTRTAQVTYISITSTHTVTAHILNVHTRTLHKPRIVLHQYVILSNCTSNFIVCIVFNLKYFTFRTNCTY